MADDRKYVLRFNQPDWFRTPHVYYTGKAPTSHFWKAMIFDKSLDAYNKRKYATSSKDTQIIRTTDRELFLAKLKGK